jgi:predicted ATPase/DNA-binding CsgD family transcriptional regulator
MTLAQLPRQSRSIVGRERELVEISALLSEPLCRLVTLLGPGGIGKTCLALEAADQQRRQASYADGVVFVDLAGTVAPDFVPAAIGGALDVSFWGPEEPLVQVMSYLADKQMLLVVDNLEHLLAGSGCLADLLNAAPGLKILATSRERLNLREEWVYSVGGLAFPPGYAGALTVSEAQAYGAVQLFVQRARQVQHHFSLADNLPSVLSICRQVEGLPLGLELAASWLHAMSCSQVAARMASSLDFLVTPLRNMPERHRSLRTLFERSWSLLAAGEQAVFMRLALFHGGFDLDAAAAITGAALPVLAGLVDKSLVRIDAAGRYDLHVLLRQYAQDKLANAGEYASTMQRFLGYYVQLAEAGEAHVYGPEQSVWYDKLEAEIDNLRAALTWSLDHHAGAVGLRIAAALRWVWEARGYLEEGFVWFTRLLAQSSDADASMRAKALSRASELGGQLAHEPQATLWAQEALQLSRAAGDEWNLAWALSTAAYFTERDLRQAAAMLEESLVMFQARQDPLGLSHTRRRRAGCAIDQGDHTYAVELLQEALAADRQAGDQNGTAWDLCFMGVALWQQHHLAEQVMPLYQESIALFRGLNDIRGMAHPLIMLAEAERAHGDAAQALGHFQSTLRLARELGIRDNLALLALAGIANLAAADGQHAAAARLLGGVDAAMQSGAYKTRISLLVEVAERTAADVRSELPAAAFAAAWSAGSTMAHDNVIGEAFEVKLGLASPSPSAAPGVLPRPVGQPLSEPLSPREREVLQLLSQGLSNAEIAHKLVISTATVKVHTRNIYGKLDVSNRAQAIVQAQKLHLL